MYEQATNCPVAGGTGEIWSEYAKFLEERERPKTARNLYLRALVGEDGPPRVTHSPDQNMLWDGFLSMMRSLKKNPDLTLDELKGAARKGGDAAVADRVGSTTPTPDQMISSPTVDGKTRHDAEDGSRPAKRSRWDASSSAAVALPVTTEMMSAGSIDTTAGVILTATRNMPPEIEMLWLARDGGSIPSRPEPALFSASPPKLGDPSGKDLVGNEAALRILQILTATTHDGKSLGSAVLDLCHACWMMTAIKEEEATRAQESIEKKILAGREALEADLDTRASVAGSAIAAVRQANERERSVFDTQCDAQRNQLLASIAWEFRKLQYTQQIMLTNAKIPGFDGPTVDFAIIALQSKVCSVLHSAFFLRARVGEASHAIMLNKQLESLKKFISTTVKIESIEQVPNHAPMQMQLQQQQQPQMIYQHPMMPMGMPPIFQQPPPMIYPGQQPMMYQPMPMDFQQFQQGHTIMHPPPQQFFGPT